MPKVASIVSHNNAFAPSVDSDTIRGGIRSKIDTAANLAALFDPDAALQSNNNSQDLVKEKGTIVYVEDQSDYFILNDATASDVAPGSAGSGWITLLSAIGGGSPTAAPAIVDNSGTPALASGIEQAEIQSTIGLVPGISGDNILQATDTGNTLADNDFLRVAGTKIEGLTAAEAVTALGLGNVENQAASGLFIKLDGTSVITSNNLFRVEGGTDDAFETQFQVADPTADRTVLFANASGTVALNGNKLDFFASTTSAEFASVISDETGTGSVVFSASPTLTGTITAAAANFSSDVTVTGNLTVSGDVVQANSTSVNFEDTILQLGVPRDDSTNAIVAQAAGSAPDTGLDFVVVTSADSIDQFASFRYDRSADKFKFTRRADAGNFTSGQVISGADNVLALKFDRTITGLATDNADVADLYGGNSSAVSNDETARSLGGVARCRITITTEASDGVNNFAPVTAAAVGYPIKHNLGTKAVFVVAIKDPDGTPIPVFCKYQPKTTNVCVVSVGITQEDEVYDIIVIG